ncbi:MAG TPA: ABC transporter permease [Bacteroidia bacterium]|jgi:putative ABC transport system permease protein|nr:ABC transporter permease [Bacteroidia bacterium]HQF27033.1 ABC transporter permease [Bacteroidia bacterium]HQK96819.1 ABC transporter permease [Bacteroidia bacterium]
MEFYLTAIHQGLAFAALGLGIFLSLRILNIPDITTDGSYTSGGIITAWMLVNGWSPVIAVFAAMIAGAIAGIITGTIHTRLKVHPLLAGIIVMTGLYSINLAILGRPNQPLINIDNLLMSPSTNSDHSSIILFVFSVVLIILINAFLKSDMGIALRATGNSESMVKSMGVNPDKMKIIGLGISNSLTALSGSLIVQYQGFGDINMGIGIVISGLGAVMIGDVVLRNAVSRKIYLQLIAVVLGCILFRLILATALNIGIDPNYLKLITAVLVLSIIAFGKIKFTSKA